MAEDETYISVDEHLITSDKLAEALNRYHEEVQLLMCGFYYNATLHGEEYAEEWAAEQAKVLKQKYSPE